MDGRHVRDAVEVDVSDAKATQALAVAFWRLWVLIALAAWLCGVHLLLAVPLAGPVALVVCGGLSVVGDRWGR